MGCWEFDSFCSCRSIRTGLEKAGVPLHHFLLHTDQETLTRRIETDAKGPGSKWRLDHVPKYHEALPWLGRQAQVIDSSALTPRQVAEIVAAKAAPMVAD
ncbi:hypothetical protein [Nonomuraea sp. NPDC049158]|uniref:hypothetical protein n=1 Tax=Nonomuraea sp. NPDC049158 TaxID=3155649 RepID=UPI0033FCB42D